MSAKIATVIVSLCLIGFSCFSNAEDKESDPDPADLTRPQSFIWIQGGGSGVKANGIKNNTGTGKITGGLSGGFNDQAEFLTLLEQEFDNKGSANTRGRLFTTFSTGNALVSKLGFSADYIRHAKTRDTTAALGVIGKVETPLEWMTIFPNFAVVEARMGSNTDQRIKSRGYQFNLFTSLYLNEAGMYSMISPQYTKLSEASVKKLEISLGGPLMTDGKIWWDIKTGYTKTDGKKILNGLTSEGTELAVGISYYF